MGLKIENGGLPPVKVLMSKKLYILWPAIEYMQQISKLKKVRLTRKVFYVVLHGLMFTYLFVVKCTRALVVKCIIL